jgi:hypothetical protein
MVTGAPLLPGANVRFPPKARFGKVRLLAGPGTLFSPSVGAPTMGFKR